MFIFGIAIPGKASQGLPTMTEMKLNSKRRECAQDKFNVHTLDTFKLTPANFICMGKMVYSYTQKVDNTGIV